VKAGRTPTSLRKETAMTDTKAAKLGTGSGKIAVLILAAAATIAVLIIRYGPHIYESVKNWF